MKLFLQESKNGTEWQNAGVTFRGKKHASSYFDERFPTNSLLDWRVGLRLVTRYGCEDKPATHYRVVDKEGNEV